MCNIVKMTIIQMETIPTSVCNIVEMIMITMETILTSMCNTVKMMMIAMRVIMMMMMCRCSGRLSCRQAKLENHTAVVQHLLCSRR